jgi:Antitoxin-like ribbon-helix-helix
MARAEPNPGAKRKIIEFDAETWQALHSLALDRMNTIQELVEDAVADLLKKHGRPVTLKEALEASAPEALDAHPPRKARKKARRAPGK